ncbi:MAG: hypothetical protein H6745_24855 [Deltaproteobacteria bacterium]|nr:hypothetical protein [Deltaproteobacteria bacterium]
MGRLILLVSIVPLVLSFTAPLWKIHMQAPQYPKGLDMLIYSYKLDGGHEGQDLAEINNLNHYIGMRHITAEGMIDLNWIPFALGFLALLVLRLVAIGNVRGLVDLAVLATYISGFALFRFVSMMYSYGHELDPAAAFKVEPFTPAIFGTKQIANFTTASYPDWGSYWLGIFISLLLGTLLWHLIAGRREALRAEQFPPSLS